MECFITVPCFGTGQQFWMSGIMLSIIRGPEMQGCSFTDCQILTLTLAARVASVDDGRQRSTWSGKNKPFWCTPNLLHFLVSLTPNTCNQHRVPDGCLHYLWHYLPWSMSQSSVSSGVSWSYHTTPRFIVNAPETTSCGLMWMVCLFHAWKA